MKQLFRLLVVGFGMAGLLGCQSETTKKLSGTQGVGKPAQVGGKVPTLQPPPLPHK